MQGSFFREGSCICFLNNFYCFLTKNSIFISDKISTFAGERKYKD